MDGLIPEGRRYTGQITVKRFCDKFGINMDFDIIFSGNVSPVDTDRIEITRINPYQIKGILEKEKKFQLYITRENQTYVASASVESVSDRSIIAKIEKSGIYRDKRRFHRFHFCCRDLGDFVLEKNGKILCDTACVYELSRSGLGIINPCMDSIGEGDVITVINPSDGLSIELKILHIKNEGRFQVLGGEIISSNLNLINYVIKKYIKVSEELILKTG
ncbi:hypothetical protein [Persephonella sp.]